MAAPHDLLPGGHNLGDRTVEGMMKPVSSRTDEALLQLVQRDGEAFGHFYDRHHMTLLGALRRRVGSTEVALDLTAEIFATALERCERFEDRGPGSATAWLFGIARFKLIDLYRDGAAENRARERLGLGRLVVDDQEIEALEARLSARQAGVQDALAALPADEQDAIRARVVDEDGYPMIAARFSVSESVVRQRVSRGLRRLRINLMEAHR